jgi:hypothetical protein
MLTGFACRDLEAVLVKYNKDEAKKSVVVCPAYLPFGSKSLPQQQSLMNWCSIVRRKTSI